MTTARSFDRSAEDVGNILLLEHVNLTVPDQGLAALFYVSGLGFTRDPYIDFGTANMWVNAGDQQFHLPKSKAQVFRGHISIVVPDLDDLARRLDALGRPLAGTLFGFERHEDHIGVRCPWGNDIRAFAPGHFPLMDLGIPRLDIQVPAGTAPGIARFYAQVMGCAAGAEKGVARVDVGHNQTLAFTETDTAIADYDGHHIAIYVADFSNPHRLINARGLITEESDRSQYRFQAIFDPETGHTLTELEHEVRSLSHPMYRRPLVNRNPAVNFFTYRKGKEIYTPS